MPHESNSQNRDSKPAQPHRAASAEDGLIRFIGSASSSGSRHSDDYAIWVSLNDHDERQEMPRLVVATLANHQKNQNRTATIRCKSRSNPSHGRPSWLHCLHHAALYHPALPTLQLRAILMSWHHRFTHTAEHLGRQALSWRTARLLCAVWFAMSSIGLPSSFSQLSDASCARDPGSLCRCSLTKRMSGTCCCKRKEKPKLATSCCSSKKPVSKPLKFELSVSRCDCPSESPEGVSLNQEPRLPAIVSVVACPDTVVAYIEATAERVENPLRSPPVPPPKIVL